jgi:hypothetical protein
MIRRKGISRNELLDNLTLFASAVGVTSAVLHWERLPYRVGV